MTTTITSLVIIAVICVLVGMPAGAIGYWLILRRRERKQVRR